MWNWKKKFIWKRTEYICDLPLRRFWQSTIFIIEMKSRQVQKIRDLDIFLNCAGKYWTWCIWNAKTSIMFTSSLRCELIKSPGVFLRRKLPQNNFLKFSDFWTFQIGNVRVVRKCLNTTNMNRIARIAKVALLAISEDLEKIATFFPWKN